jgi:glycine betaine/proline transport system permease protein
MNVVMLDEAMDRIIENGVDWLDATFSFVFKTFNLVMGGSFSSLGKVLLYFPFYVIIAIAGIVAWRTAGRSMAIFTVLGLLFCRSMNLWQDTMMTTALVIVSTVAALVIAIPFGILAARNNVVNHIARPLMDFLQTMPAYVYLIPAIAFLGYGPNPGIGGTILIAFPVALRLTNLGIRLVPSEQVEVGHAFGATPGEILRKIQLPAALPTIMAGVNQCLMIALGMAVIAGIVGAGGLGEKVYAAIRVLEIGQAFDAGLAIVILAIILDRISQGAANLLKRGQHIK